MGVEGSFIEYKGENKNFFNKISKLRKRKYKNIEKYLNNARMLYI